MFLNYLAGTVSLVLAVSAFVPWVTVWIYSLKGIENLYGIIILVSGILGVTVSFFQHLSGRARGRTFFFIGLVTLLCEGLYYRKISLISSQLDDIVGLLKEFFGQAVHDKLTHWLGEAWMQMIPRLLDRMGWQIRLEDFNFVGGGLVLAAVCSLGLLFLGVLLEKNKVEQSIL